jgi:hypothetical protein
MADRGRGVERIVFNPVDVIAVCVMIVLSILWFEFRSSAAGACSHFNRIASHG